MSDKQKELYIFKHYIAFLEIYGQENFGSNVEVRWNLVYREILSNSLLDFNTELENVLYAGDYDSEEFRDAVFSFIENKVLEGYPIWRSFKMSKWLEEKLEQEHQELINEEIKKEYYKYPCYHCKYYKNEWGYMCDTVNGIQHIRYREFKKLTEKQLSHMTVHAFTHDPIKCLKRQELISEYKKTEKEKHPNRHIHFGDDYIPLDYRKFTFYKDESSQFDLMSRERTTWKLVPEELKDCPYFEENGVSYEQRIEEYGAI